MEAQYEPIYGAAKMRCAECGHEMFVAFSCKGRGICPSCQARRMSEVAATLTDTLLPLAPYRQWVFTYPVSAEQGLQGR